MPENLDYDLEYPLLQAREDFEAIPRELHLRAARVLESLRDEPRPKGAEKLEGAYRLIRRGIRIVYDVDDANRIILVARVSVDPAIDLL